MCVGGGSADEKKCCEIVSLMRLRGCFFVVFFAQNVFWKQVRVFLEQAECLNQIFNCFIISFLFESLGKFIPTLY